jgi:hypothetical protein
MEVGINNLPIMKSQELNEFKAKFYKSFKEELAPMLLKSFHKVERKGTLLNWKSVLL